MRALNPLDPPARPEDLAAIASSGTNAPAIMAAATMAAIGAAKDLRMSSLGWALQTILPARTRLGRVVERAGRERASRGWRTERAITFRTGLGFTSRFGSEKYLRSSHTQTLTLEPLTSSMSGLSAVPRANGLKVAIPVIGSILCFSPPLLHDSAASPEE